ncbi:MAG: restriction endonuclease subunit S [Vibrio sp.]
MSEGEYPALRFKCFSAPWEKADFSQIAQDFSYGMNAAAVPFNGKDKYIRITDIDDNLNTFSPSPLTSPEGGGNEKYKLRTGDIVFARTGASTGKPYLYSKYDGDLFFAGFLIKASITKGIPCFIYQFCKTSTYTKWVSIMSMRSGQPGINAEEYKGLCVPFPDKQEQQKIADFLTAVDTKINQLTEKHRLLKEYKKSVMQQIFSQQLRFKDKDGKAFPEWEEKHFGEVFGRVTQKNSVNNLNVLTISAQKGLISQLEYFNKSVSAKDVSGYYLLRKGDFAYNKSYSQGYPMGAIKPLKFYDSGVVSTLYICFRPKKGFEEAYFEQFFDAGMLNREIAKIAQEGARNHGLLNVSVKEFFDDIKLLVPHQNEQQKIAQFLQVLDSKITAVSEQIEQTKQFKKGLLQQMFV